MKSEKLIILLVLTLVAGCSRGDFPTAKVDGIVLCEGKPVASAAVYFEPLQSSNMKMIVGKQGFAFTDDNGRFKISTYFPGQNDGAVVGKHRVRVGRGDAKCNCSMNDEKDVMEVEVKGGQVNTFEVVLQSASADQLDKEKKDRIIQGVDEDGT